ncbi:MAG: hypothetical protein RLZZ58_1, partial [Pseudomonadota bacterium]
PIPGLPGATNSFVQFGDCASFHASACSRPPDPINRMFMPDPFSNPYDDDDDDAPPSRLVAKDAVGDNAPPLSVSEISNAVKRAVEGQFGRVRIRGELSGAKRAASGHFYCALKDDAALIDAVMWKGQAARLGFRPEDGLDVIATGRLTTYPGRSKYQLIIESMEIAGEGALMALFEKTRARLAAEGLFDQSRKRPLPVLPRVIGVVTSPTGAVIRDILHRLADRCPTPVLVWPVLVQGEGAAAQIAGAIAGFGALQPGGAVPRPDLIIVARGGGSIEDLWAFNEEAVVRAIAACPIPLISAVGHETDVTLADHAADMRAPTPTAAAEMAVPVRSDLRARIADMHQRIRNAASQRQARSRERLDALVRLLPRRDRLYEPQRQRVDDARERLGRAAVRSVGDARQRLAARAGSLRPALLTRRLDMAGQRLGALVRVMRSLDPQNLLTRGYAMVTDRAGGLVTSAAAARAAARLTLRFADGDVDAAAGDAPPAPAHAAAAPVAAPSPRRRPPGAPGQGQLL